MFAIVYKSDGVPICVQMPGVSPDPVVVWSSESAARAFIESKGGGKEFQPVSVDEQAMEKMAKALGCPGEKLMLEPYPSYSDTSTLSISRRFPSFAPPRTTRSRSEGDRRRRRHSRRLAAWAAAHISLRFASAFPSRS